MKALFLFVCAVLLLCLVASSAEACDRCQVASVAVYDKIVGEFQVVERTTVAREHYVRAVPVETCGRCHLRHSLCRCIGRVVGVGRATVGTVYDTGTTAVRVAISVPVEAGGLVHRTVHRFDHALFEGRRSSHRYRD